MTKIISVDPAFKRCGVVVLTDDYRVHAHENIDFIGDKGKQNQTDYTISLFRAIKDNVDRLVAEHKPDLFLLENQIGKFACTQVHSLFVACVDLAGVKVLSQSPKFKLQEQWGLVDYVERDCNAYNKNKNRAKAAATHFCKESKQELNLDRDISDALLQGLFYVKHVLKSPFDYATVAALSEPKVEAVAEAVAQPVEEAKSVKRPKSAKRVKRAKSVKPAEAVPEAVVAEAVPEAEVVLDEVVEFVAELPKGKRDRATGPKKSQRKSPTKEEVSEIKSIATEIAEVAGEVLTKKKKATNGQKKKKLTTPAELEQAAEILVA